MLRTSFLIAPILAAACAWGQQPTPTDQPAPAGQTPTATAPAAAPAAPSIWSVGGIDFSGLIDGYYTFNANHPDPAFNQLYNFNERANQFSLNMAKLTASHDADPVGFRLDIGFGRAFDTIHTTEQAPEIFRYLEQAYVSWKPKSGHGFEADFGEFVTSAGAEVIETKDNWNYSRSLLFAYAIPYYHFGLRTSVPIGSWNAGVQVVNGWNNVEDSNSGKTIGITGGITKKKFTWSNNYYTGPENSDSNKGFRNLYDTTLLLTPKDAFNAYIDFDYGHDRPTPLGIPAGTGFGAWGGPASVHWVGLAAAAHFQVSKHVAITPRAEFFNDADGFTTSVDPANPRAQRLAEVTVTGEYKMDEGLLTRLEYRRDSSNIDYFNRGVTPNASKDQTTVTLGIVAFFGPKR
jgi:hypothetical protein